MEIESEAATDPKYYIALQEGRMIADTKILAIRILNDFIENLPARIKTLPPVIWDSPLANPV